VIGSGNEIYNATEVIKIASASEMSRRLLSSACTRYLTAAGSSVNAPIATMEGSD
jgi:hypothetical protein